MVTLGLNTLNGSITDSLVITVTSGPETVKVSTRARCSSSSNVCAMA